MTVKMTSPNPKGCPTAPPLPGHKTVPRCKKVSVMDGSPLIGQSCVPTATLVMWDRMFDEAYGADVVINTKNGGSIYAHSSILAMASPVFRGMLKQSKVCGRRRSISICGVPHETVRVFIRFLYSSCYTQEEMEENVLNLLVLSHVFVMSTLKQICEQTLEKGMINTDNVIDIFQLSLLCDAPRLSFICHRMIMKNFEAISDTRGWKVMKQSHPVLENILLESMIEADTSRKERVKKANERKVYLQLYEAMEALVHICRDGCRTIGPHDKVLKEDQAHCGFETCKGLELLVRHFAGCKLRVPGGCLHCKRMWQLLELHSRLCADSNACRVPLCGSFKVRATKQNKKDEKKWKILVKNIFRAKSIGGSSFFPSAAVVS